MPDWICGTILELLWSSHHLHPLSWNLYLLICSANESHVQLKGGVFCNLQTLTPLQPLLLFYNTSGCMNKGDKGPCKFDFHAFSSVTNSFLYTFNVFPYRLSMSFFLLQCNFTNVYFSSFCIYVFTSNPNMGESDKQSFEMFKFFNPFQASHALLLPPLYQSHRCSKSYPLVTVWKIKKTENSPWQGQQET